MRGEQAKRFLVALAIVALATAVTTLWLVTKGRDAALLDTGETRAHVSGALARDLPAQVTSARDPALAEAAQKLGKEKYVAAFWIVDVDGTIILKKGTPLAGKEGQNVRDVGDMGKVLSGLDRAGLSESQKAQLLAIGAIRAEGEHNDVFRHLVWPVASLGGGQVLVAVAYDVSAGIGTPVAGYKALVLLFAGSFVTYWLALPLWVYLDSRSRNEPSRLWALFVLITNLMGLLAYLLATTRPRRATQ